MYVSRYISVPNSDKVDELSRIHTRRRCWHMLEDKRTVSSAFVRYLEGKLSSITLDDVSVCIEFDILLCMWIEM